MGASARPSAPYIEVCLASEGTAALEAASRAVERDLRSLSGIGNVTSGASLQRPEIQPRPDFARAADIGVTTAALAGAVRVATSGAFAVSLPKLNLPQRQISIRMHLDKAMRQDLDAIAQLRVPAKAGPVPLSAVADLTLGGGPAQINRVGRRRTVNIDVELGGRLIGAVMAEADALPSLANPPPGLERVPAGRRPAHG